MKQLAIFALTKKGAQLGNTIAKHLPEYKLDIFLPAGIINYLAEERLLWQSNNTINYKKIDGPLPDELYRQFGKYHGFLMVMAMGIVVRTIAPLLRDKRTDPAVICFDELGEHVVSVAAGHLGGANELTKLIAERINATPVITTSTDVNKTLSFDLIAQKYNLGMEPFHNLKYFNGAMVNGEKVIVYTNLTLPQELIKQFQNVQIPLLSLTESDIEANHNHYSCIIAEKDQVKIPEDKNRYLFLYPKSLIIGVGCRRGTEPELIINAIKEGVASLNKSPGTIKKIVSVDVKKDEPGILLAARHLGTQVEFFSATQLKEVMAEGNFARSQFVNKSIGVEGVCEPAAILGGVSPKLLLKKTIFPKVTIAIAQEKYLW
ncbi:MAG: cobalt-precorrin 5A hydrolase [Clostridia bacterium]|jgi:cobalt-precorrin 5A hydrolase|nr:cobalt-precorrin 5A hydrolase [Clostridia bacterium]